MKKEELQKEMKRWYKEHTIHSQRIESIEAEMIDVKEILSLKDMIISRSFYRIDLNCEMSNSGLPSSFIYATTELLKTDIHTQDIIELNILDYEILNH